MELIWEIIFYAIEWDIIVMIEEDLGLDYVYDIDGCALDSGLD